MGDNPGALRRKWLRRLSAGCGRWAPAAPQAGTQLAFPWVPLTQATFASHTDMYNYFMKKNWNLWLKAGGDITVAMQYQLHENNLKNKPHKPKTNLYCTSLNLWILARPAIGTIVCKSASTEVSEGLGRTQKHCSAPLPLTYSYVSGWSSPLEQRKVRAHPALLRMLQTLCKSCAAQMTEHTVMYLNVSQAHSQTLANKMKVCQTHYYLQSKFRTPKRMCVIQIAP